MREKIGTGFNFFHEDKKYLVTCKHIISESYDHLKKDETVYETIEVFRDSVNLIYPRMEESNRILDRKEFDIELNESN